MESLRTVSLSALAEYRMFKQGPSATPHCLAEGAQDMVAVLTRKS